MTEERRTIRSLRANVTQAEAIAAFQGGSGRWLRPMLGGELRRVAAAYLPFRLYEVVITERGGSTTCLFALDAVSGTMDLYQLDALPGDAELSSIETRNCPEAVLEEARALQLLHDKVQRAVFLTGFFRVRGLALRARRLPVEFHVPYWLGFFGNGARARLRVMDAVRRRFEGGKARAIFQDWIEGRGRMSQPAEANAQTL